MPDQPATPPNRIDTWEEVDKAFRKLLKGQQTLKGIVERHIAESTQKHAAHNQALQQASAKADSVAAELHNNNGPAQKVADLNAEIDKYLKELEVLDQAMAYSTPPNPPSTGVT